MIRIHDAEGFAFTPHNRLPVDGDITYGDVSIDLDYIKKHWSAWKLIDSKVNEIDPYQVIVYLVPC